MAVKLNVGFAKKQGQPNYGSIGATCHIECELDSALLFHDPAGFQAQVQGIYNACTQAVHDELARNQPGKNETRQPECEQKGSGQHANGNGHAQSNRDSDQNGRGTQSNSCRRSTPAQVRALYAIANCQGLDLPALLRERCDVDRPEGLTRTEASQLIDLLQATANGVGDH